MSDNDAAASQPFVANSDLFDAEIDSDPEIGNDNYGGQDEQEDDDDNKSNHDREDSRRELSDELDQDAEERDRQSKKCKEPRKRRVKRADVQNIHSESQRLIRETNVKLPYHQPAAKDITHFLKRVPVKKDNLQTMQTRNDDVMGNSGHEDDTNVKTQQSSLSRGDLNGFNDSSAGPTTVAPKLSAATDAFFLDDHKPKKPMGMNHLIERFFKHSGVKKKPNVQELPIQEPEEKLKEIPVNDNAKNAQTSGKEEGGTSTKLKPVILPGDKLMNLKEKLQEHMKLQRAKIREIHESQRKIDNEEVSEEEEEEDDDDEDDEDDEDDDDEDDDEDDEEEEEQQDTDFEVEKWNAEDERGQEECKNKKADKSGIKTKEEENHETSDTGLNNDSDLSHGRAKLQSVTENNHPMDKIHVYSDEKTMDLFSSDTSNQNAGEKPDVNDSESQESDGSIKLRLDSVDKNEDTTGNFRQEETTLFAFTKLKTPLNFIAQEQSSGDSTIPAAQQETERTDKKTRINLNSSIESLTPFSRIEKLLAMDASSQAKQKSKPLSELTLPIEDSQDLYDDNDILDSKKGRDGLSTSKDFHFVLDEDTQFTQFVDTQGYLLSTSKKKKKTTEKDSQERSKMSELLGLCTGTFADHEKTKPGWKTQEDNMSELLGLCSGKFPDQAETNSDFGFHSESGNDTNETNQDSNMSELLGLCSGHFSGLINSQKRENYKDTQSGETKNGSESGIFSSRQESGVRKSRSKQGLSSMFDAIAEGNGLEDAVALCSGEFPATQKSTEAQLNDLKDTKDNIDQLLDGNTSEEVFSDDEDERKGLDDEGEDIDDDVSTTKKYAITYGKLRNPIFDKNNFVEEEAELSGSDFSSDEDECGDDELEEESEEEDLPSDEELQRQVNKVHMKSLIDEDKKELRAFQERYLEDGDLYSEGGGRSRNFRWHALDDSQIELFNNKVLWGDDEVVDSELLSQAEVERRKMRHEKDQFLQEQLEQAGGSQNIDVDENSQNILNLIRDTSNAAAGIQNISNENATPKPQDPKSTKPSLKRGSFLGRSKDQLSRLSSITATKKTPNSARGFVFHTVSPTSKAKQNSAQKLQRSVSLSEPPNAKRPRLDRNCSNIATGSLFSII